MEVETLKKIAFNKVREYARKGSLIVPVKAPAEISNLIFEDANRHAIKPSCPIDFSKLSVTRAHLSFVDKSELLQLLTQHKLKELGLSFLEKFHRTYADIVTGRSEFQIVCDCLFESRNSLTTLVCPEFSDEFNWLDALLPLHPNLCNLDFEGNTEFRFTSVLNVYPQITFLNFSNTYIIDLEGLSSCFPNIEVLYLSNAKHRSMTDVQDIFQLKNLKVLDIACSYDKDIDDNSNIDINPWYFDEPNSFPSLEFVDYSQKDVSAEKLDQLFAAAPKLKKLGLIMSEMPDINREGVEILCTKDLPSAVKAFKHYHSDNRHLFVGPILRDIHEMLSAAPPFETHKKILWELLDLLMDRIEIDEMVHDGMAKEWAIKSIALFCQHYSEKLTEDQKREIVLLVVPWDDKDLMSCSIFGLPQIINVRGLNPFFFYKKAIGYFLAWRDTPELSHEALYPMLNALYSYGSRLSDQTSAAALGKKMCFEKMNYLLCEMWAQLQRRRVSEEWIYSNCIKVKAVQEKLLNSRMMLTIEDDQIINIRWFEHVPIIQLTALEVMEKQLYCVKPRTLKKWASSIGREEFEILVKCLMGNFDSWDNASGRFLEREIAIVAMKILTLLVQLRKEKKTELIAKLRNQAVDMEYRDFSIAAIKNDHLFESRAYPIVTAINAREWAAAVYKELVCRAVRFPKLVKEKGVWKNIQGEALVENDADVKYSRRFKGNTHFDFMEFWRNLNNPPHAYWDDL